MQRVPGVQQAVARVVTGREGRDFLVGYVVADAGGSAHSEGLVEAVRAEAVTRLPGYMVPSVVRVIEAVPITVNGKVDRERLSVPSRNHESAGDPPVGRVETVLANVIASVIGVLPLGREDNFFEKGGDSLLAMQVVARAQAAGVSLTVRQLFAHPVVRELAAVATVTEERARDTGAAVVAPTPMGEWLRELQLSDDAPVQHAAVRVPKGFTAEVAQELLGSVVRTHRILCSRRVVADDGRWLLEVPTVEALPPINELLHTVPMLVGQPNTDAEAIEAVVAQLRGYLAPDEGRLTRFALMDVPSGGAVLLIVIHHLVVDAASWPVLLDDLRQGWDALQTGQPIALSGTPVTFAEWSDGMTAAAVAAADHLPAWIAHTRAAWEPVGLPAADGSVVVRTVTVPAKLTQTMLRDAAPELGARLDEVLLVAFAQAVEKVFGRPDSPMLVDVESHGRMDAHWHGGDLSRAVGWFTEMHPLRLWTKHARSRGDVLGVARALLQELRGGVIAS